MVFKQFVTIFDTFYTHHALPSKKLVKFKFQSSEPYHGHTQTPIVSLKITYCIILNPVSSVYDIFEIFLAHFFDHGFSANFTGPNQAVKAPLSYADIHINIPIRISANSFRGNYSFLNLTLCTVTLMYCEVHTGAETIQGRKLFAEIR